MQNIPIKINECKLAGWESIPFEEILKMVQLQNSWENRAATPCIQSFNNFEVVLNTYIKNEISYNNTTNLVLTF